MKEAITFSAFLAVALCATTVQAGAKTMPILGWHGIQPDQIPTATVRLAAVDLPAWVTSLETPDGSAVVSRLANGGKEYLVAVNCSPEKELTLKIALASGTKRVRTDGTLVDAALYTNEYWIEPDVAEVFQAPQAAVGEDTFGLVFADSYIWFGETRRNVETKKWNSRLLRRKVPAGL